MKWFSTGQSPVENHFTSSTSLIDLAMLNENLTFGQLDGSVQRSFNGLTAKHERIKMGTLLYKFTDYELFNPNGRITPFWGTMEDLADLLAYSKKKGKPLLECIRKRNAVLHNWNGLNSLIIIQISPEDVYGFTGNIGPQTEKGYGKDETYTRHFTRSIALWGGASQVVLPGLKRKDILEVVPSDTVLIRDETDAILEFLNDLVLI